MFAGRARLALEAVRVVESAVARGQPADRTLSAWLREHPQCGSRDRRFLNETVYSILRWRGWTGTAHEAGGGAIALAGALDGPLQPPALQLAREAGLHPETWMPAADRSLAALGRAFAQWTGRPVPEPDALAPDGLAAVLAVPDGADPAAHRLHFLTAIQTRPPLWLRAVGAPAAEVVRRLHHQNVQAAACPRLAGAIRLDQHPHLGRLEQAVGPCFEVQDIASQVVGHICAPRPGEAWLDLCAGAGGKTLHLVDLAARQARVTACDVRRAPLDDLLKRARRLGVQDQVRTAMPAVAAQELFDGVLVDAPCSGLGTWSRNPDARWRTPADAFDRLAAEQRKLLDEGAAHVRPGGSLVYAVCTLTARETTEQARSFLARRPEFEPHPSAHPLAPGQPPAAGWWVWPWQGPGGGMFIARFRRRG